MESARVEFTKRSRFDLIKTFFEIMALFSGIGAVYYTIINLGSTALILDLISVITTIFALTMSIQHFKISKEINLLNKLMLLNLFPVSKNKRPAPSQVMSYKNNKQIE